MATFSERLARVERGRSPSAEWCQKLAFFSVPYFIIIIVGHRTGALETLSTFWLIGIGLLVLAACLVFGIRGLFDLWSKGQVGGLNSARGIALALLMLTPFIYHGFLAFALPPLYDISTDLEAPPEFENALRERTEEMNEISDPGQSETRLQLQAYPRVVARRYPLGAGRIFREVAALINDRDWQILTAEGVAVEAPIDDEGSALVAARVVDENGIPLTIPTPKCRPKINPENSFAGFESVAVAPVGRNDQNEGADTSNTELDERYIEAVAQSFVFGFKSDVVVRIIEEEDGTLIDIRSNSRWGPHDLGSNAKRITEFMADLDTALQGLGTES